MKTLLSLIFIFIFISGCQKENSLQKRKEEDLVEIIANKVEFKELIVNLNEIQRLSIFSKDSIGRNFDNIHSSAPSVRSREDALNYLIKLVC